MSKRLLKNWIDRKAEEKKNHLPLEDIQEEDKEDIKPLTSRAKQNVDVNVVG